ncbi:COG2127 Uncharacterized conserved protein [uncultured Caudovirales phage]|uniref:COG2127 Uncharacterized conserved protein n=1 Tax=uncultured Caudovirales phage TaxID=2100421 RepID=A0A6J5L6M6_9CAUD|nr:COG2127 Uncharacterized conserved protein [uncultured Caudovirales phage]
MSKAATDTKTKIQVNTKVKEPSKYRVLYLNDDVTSMDFVVESLVIVFKYDHDTAVQTTIAVHEQGSAVVAVLPYEIAEQKAIEVTLMAREAGFPFQVKIEAAV